MLRQKNLLRWKSLLANHLPKGRRRKRSAGSSYARRLAAEPLEDRRMLATLTVTSVADTIANDGVVTLREAITAANTNAPSGDAPAGDVGLDNIHFNIPGAGPHTIQPTSSLPTITDLIVIDGFTQPGAAPNTADISSAINATLQIELDGSVAGPFVNGLTIAAGNSTVRGLVINRFTDDGIELMTAGGNTIHGNFIGTDVTGEIDFGNGDDGVYVVSVSANTIGGSAAASRNLISGNEGDGIHLQGTAATVNAILGNFIGTDKDGDTDLGNGSHGVHIASAVLNTIGGTSTAARNVISGNDSSGISITGDTATGNVVLGNYIGTDRIGTSAVGNDASGVTINNAPSNTIGGTATGAGNLISANNTGVIITNTSATGNFVLGNKIGTDVNGTANLGNSGSGVVIDEAGNNTVGGTATNARNLISGNDAHGVSLLGDDSDNNTVLGNYIGTNAAGTADLGNALDGVRIDTGDNNTIGGTSAGAGNLISGNNDNGVHILGDPVEFQNATGNQVQGNLIGTNAAGTAGIANSDDGVLIANASNNTIGGTTTSARNVISANGDEGIEINGAAATFNKVQGNYIGTQIDGTTALGNANDGVEIVNATDNLIGGTALGAGNVVAFNGTEGVEVQGAAATGNAIRRNSIFRNSTIGIDLLEDSGVTPNDVNDPDDGPNILQNFPEFVGVGELVGNMIQLTYFVDSLPANSAYPLELEFFVADVDSEEGEIYFATSTYFAAEATNGKTITIPTHPLLPARDIVATVTDANGNTSEFSAPLEVAKLPDRFEFNNTLATATVLGSEETVIERDLNILDEFDEDFFKITAHDTGKMIINIFFEHALGDLRLEVQDMHGNVIADADASDSDNNFEEIIIPVVSQEMYFVRVVTNDGETACYDLEIENFPAPVPEMPFLHPEDDNGGSNSDGVTNVLNPRIFIQADLADFAAMGIEILSAAEAEAGEDDGAAVEVFVNGVSVGFADPVGASDTLFQFELDSAVLESGIEINGGYLNYITAAVRVFDGQADAAGDASPASGRTQLSKPLDLTTPLSGIANIGTWAAGTVLIDSNGNYTADPQLGPFVDGDTAYLIGFDSDYIFAGNFSPFADDFADGYDKLAAYGQVDGDYRWIVDTDGDGVIDIISFEPSAVNGYPVAGNFDGDPFNGDEVGLFDGTYWHFDTDHDFQVDTMFFADGYNGFPIVGDFDGDGDDDVGTYAATTDEFAIVRNDAGPFADISIGSTADYFFQIGTTFLGGYGFANPRQRPVAADFNADGVDDIGIWSPDGILPVPNELSEWFILVSADDPFTDPVETSVLDRIVDGFVPFLPEPFGQDIYAQFGNTFALPVVGHLTSPAVELEFVEPIELVQQLPVAEITLPPIEISEQPEQIDPLVPVAALETNNPEPEPVEPVLPPQPAVVVQEETPPPAPSVAPELPETPPSQETLPPPPTTPTTTRAIRSVRGRVRSLSFGGGRTITILPAAADPPPVELPAVPPVSSVIEPELPPPPTEIIPEPVAVDPPVVVATQIVVAAIKTEPEPPPQEEIPAIDAALEGITGLQLTKPDLEPDIEVVEKQAETWQAESPAPPVSGGRRYRMLNWS